MSNKITIGLLWHSANSDNLGVGALTVSQIKIISEVAEELGLIVFFKILGWSDPEPSYIQGENIEVVGFRGKDMIWPGGLYAAMRKCDLILDISAGDSFADIYGARRFIFNILGKLNVLAAGRPLVLSPQTIGPFQRWWAKRLALLAISGSRTVVTRDGLSSKYLREMGFKKKIVESTDVALVLPYEKGELKETERCKVGLNVSGLLFNGGYSQKNMFSLSTDYKELVLSICRYFSELENVDLYLIGHVNSRNHEIEDDHRVAEGLVAKFPQATLAPRFATPSAAKSYISNMDFFVGSRMHACIAAFSSGVPVLPIAYSRKFLGLFGTLDYPYVADCKTQSAKQILKAVVDSFEHRRELKTAVEKSLDIAKQKKQIYLEELRSVIAEVR